MKNLRLSNLFIFSESMKPLYLVEYHQYKFVYVVPYYLFSIINLKPVLFFCTTDPTRESSTEIDKEAIDELDFLLNDDENSAQTPRKSKAFLKRTPQKRSNRNGTYITADLQLQYHGFNKALERFLGWI